MISIIIPIFNTERYIKKCLNSIIKQDYKKLEIILIIDGSNDKCFKICKKFSLKDKRIKIIYKKENEGVERARIDGINYSSGEYIFFIDSDDWLENNTVLSLLRNSIKEDLDYVQVGVKKVLDKHGLINIKWNKYPDRIIHKDELEKLLIGTFLGNFNIDVNCWGKLYRSDFLKKANLKPLGYIFQEDLMFHLQLYTKFNKILILKKIGYCYRWGGMTKKYSPLKYINLKSQYNYRRSFFHSINKSQYINELNLWMLHSFKSEIQERINKSLFKKDKNNILEYIKQEIYSFPLNLVLKELEDKKYEQETLKIFINRNCSMIYKYSLDQVLRQIFKERISMMIKKIIRLI